MKKIAIFGSYNGSSIGDTAILLGLIASIERIYSDEELEIRVILAKKFNLDEDKRYFGINANVRYYFWKKYSHGFFSLIEKIFLNLTGSKINSWNLKNFLKDVDHLVIGGGNLVMDLYPAWPKILFTVCKKSKRLGVPYSFVGVGASPIDSKAGKKFLDSCLKNASKAFFRDEGSKEYVKRKLGYEAFLMPDLIFGLPNIERKLNRNSHPILLLNVAPVYSRIWPQKNQKKYERYCDQVSNFISSILSNELFKRVVFLRSNHIDLAAEIEIKDRILHKNPGLHVDIDIEENFLVSRLFQLSSNAESAVTTRLHAGLIAAISGCSILPISYQPKVQAIFSELGIENSMDVTDLLSLQFLNKATSDFQPLDRAQIDCKRQGVDRCLALVLEGKCNTS